MKRRVSTESIILVAICLVDMLSTLYFVLTGHASERNPLMAFCLHHSPVWFILVKIASFIPFVAAVEIYRRKNHAFAIAACRLAIIAYLVTFIVLTIGVNA